MSMNDHDLVLYMKPTCPFCVKVLNFMKERGIVLQQRNISVDAEAAETLVRVGGKRQVPCLFIDGEPLYESSDIIAWLDQNA